MQSIVTRLVIVTGGALLLFAAPIVLLLGAEGYWDDKDNSALYLSLIWMLNPY